MKPSLHYTLRLFLSLLLPVGLLLVMNLIPTVPATTVTAAADCASSGVPIVTTDKADYGPSEIVMISGSGFGCGDTLAILVTAPDGNTRSGDGMGSNGPDLVTTDLNGAFTLSYRLTGAQPDGGAYMGQQGNYSVIVLNSAGDALANTMFSDSMGGTHSCILTTSGGVKCWGNNLYGQLGNGTYTNSYTPVDVSGLTSDVSQISVGGFHACALTTSGGVKCWGYNGSGQLGDGTTVNRNAPVDVPGLSSGVIQVNAGSTHTCALTASGGVKCWGYNGLGQLGDGSNSYNSTMPVDVSGLSSGVAQISLGELFTCALMVDGGVKCWGYNWSGQLGDGTTTDRRTPVDVIGLGTPVTQISTGTYHSCAMTASGGVKCWGWNANGQLGDGTAYDGIHSLIRTTPVDVYGLTSGVIQISVGSHHSCALTAGGGTWCWGWSYYGQVGDGTFTNMRITPANVVDLDSGVVQIASGLFHTCALTISDKVLCWGYNYHGQLGDGTTIHSSIPVDVIGLDHKVACLPDGVPVLPLNSPPSVEAGGPYDVDEGGEVALVASGSDPEGGPLTYAWDLDYDGSYETPGESVIFSAGGLDGPSSAMVAVQATDSGGLSATSQSTINIRNVAPTATFANTSGKLIAGQTALLAFTDPFDPSAADATAGFQYAYDCNSDGVFETGDSAANTFTCAYPNSGVFTTTGRIQDKDSGFTDYTVEITVLTPQQGIAGVIDQVQELVQTDILRPGPGNALVVKLEAAIQQLDRGNNLVAINQLEAFINQVEAMIGAGTLAEESGRPLINAAIEILAVLR